MKHLKPATATSASAGIRRMELGQPPALGMRTCGGKGVGQWPLAMGCANREHPTPKPQVMQWAHLYVAAYIDVGAKNSPYCGEHFKVSGQAKEN